MLIEMSIKGLMIDPVTNKVVGEIKDIDCAVGERPCLDPGANHGYEVDEAEVTFWGLCPACKRRRADD